jgi:hypothetical protein
LEIITLKRSDSSSHLFGSCHRDEGKTTWATGFTVHWKVDVRDITILRKQLTNIELAGAKGQVAHIHLGIHYQVISSWTLLLNPDDGLENRV